MNIFVITDNKWWLNKITNLFNKKGYNFSCYCSPKGRAVFNEEIKSGSIRVIDLKREYSYLIRDYNLGFSVHCKQIFPKDLVESVRCINIHPGLNPFNRGWFPQVFSIINKKPIGATIHIMDYKIDHGDILCQKEIDIKSWDDSKSVYDRVLKAEFALLKLNIDKIVHRSVKAREMALEGNYNSISDFNKLKQIDMDRNVTMREAIDYLRAMTHPPYKNAYFITKEGEKIFVSIDLERQTSLLENE